jgi:hypothetical protein
VSSALPFVPMSVESFRRLGAPALTLLDDLADQAVQASRRAWPLSGRIHRGKLRELSVTLCWGNVSLCWSGAYVSTRASGRTLMRGLARLSAEVVEACFAPRVCVLGVLVRHHLDCVALLCAVYVSLHCTNFVPCMCDCT